MKITQIIDELYYLRKSENLTTDKLVISPEIEYALMNEFKNYMVTDSNIVLKASKYRGMDIITLPGHENLILIG